MKNILVLFADAPTVDFAPLSFAEAFTTEECVSLLAAFYRDTFEAMSEVQDEDDDTSLVLCYYPTESLEAFEEADLNGCAMLAQRGETRSDRLANCLSDLNDLGGQNLTIIVKALPVLDAEGLVELQEISGQSKSLVIATTENDRVVLGSGSLQSALTSKSFQSLLATPEAIKGFKGEPGITIVSGFPSVDDAVDRPELEKMLKESETGGYFTRRALKKLRQGLPNKS